MRSQKLYETPFNTIYTLYKNKVERKGKDAMGVNTIISWLTSYSLEEIHMHCQKSTLQQFFNEATLNPNRKLITGVICGVRVESIEHPLMQEIRYLDMLIDEFANGKTMDRILRQGL